MVNYQMLIDNVQKSEADYTQAWNILGQGGDEAVTAMIHALHNHTDMKTRKFCVQILAKLNDPRIQDAFLWSIQNDESWEVRSECMENVDVEQDVFFEATLEQLKITRNHPIVRIGVNCR